MHSRVHFGHESVHLFLASFGLELHPAIDQIPNEARYFKFLRYLGNHVAEPYALNTALKENDFVVNFDHAPQMLKVQLPSGNKQKRLNIEAPLCICIREHRNQSLRPIGNQRMIPKDSDSSSDGEYEDPGELGWSEFDWEKYLRLQDDIVHRYLGFYEKFKGSAERIDEVAQAMGWDRDNESDELPEEETEIPETEEMEPYTLQKNPVYISTTAIYLSLQRHWEHLCASLDCLDRHTSIAYLASLHRGEMNATLAIQSLDLGDYTMAVSLFKRAMRELNASLSLLGSDKMGGEKLFLSYRENAYSQIFDLREIWLRIIAECREEVSRHGRNKTAEDDSQS